MSTIEQHAVTDRELEWTLSYPVRQTGPTSVCRDAQVFHRVSTKTLCRLVRQLATLLRAGMPLVHALSVLAEQWRSPTDGRRKRRRYHTEHVAAIVERIRDDVNEGSTVADALGKRPSLFSPFFVNMVAAGERSGTLEEALSRLADILEKRVQLLGKIKSAIAYPLMMAVVAAGVVMFLLSFVVPQITQLFIEMDQQLPWPTRLLMATSGFVQMHFVPMMVTPCVLIAGVYMVSRTHEGRLRLDRIKLRLPFLGPLWFRLEVARLARTLGTLMKSGIPVVGAIDITQNVVQNRVVADAMNAIKDGVHKGQAIAEATKSTGLFPPVVYHLIATSQMSGNVESGLMDIADMYDTEVEAAVRTLTSLLEPMILLVMGAVVGFIVLAILLPIFEINQVL